MTSASIQYRRELQQLLGSADEELTRRLRDFIASQIPADVAHVYFEDCADPHGAKFPVLIALTTEKNDVYCDARRCALSSIPFRLPSHLNPAASDCGVDDASEEWEEVFYPWFRERWVAAGGSSFGVPAYIGERDATVCFELKNGEWIETR